MMYFPWITNYTNTQVNELKAGIRARYGAGGVTDDMIRCAEKSAWYLEVEGRSWNWGHRHDFYDWSTGEYNSEEQPFHRKDVDNIKNEFVKLIVALNEVRDEDSQMGAEHQAQRAEREKLGLDLEDENGLRSLNLLLALVEEFHCRYDRMVDKYREHKNEEARSWDMPEVHARHNEALYDSLKEKYNGWSRHYPTTMVDM